MDNLLPLFCIVDDFCKNFEPEWNKYLLQNNIKKRIKPSSLTTSEIMTIVILFHQSCYRNFKTFYLKHVAKYLLKEFPQLVSYNRFVELTKNVIIPLCFFAQLLTGKKTGIYFIDSMIIKACHIKREKQNKVFKGIAQKAKSSVGWFFGFKLHLVINDCGEIMAFKLTAGNVDDRKVAPDLMSGLFGKLFADKGYISQNLFSKLFDLGVQLITKLKKNMKNKLMPVIDKILLRKRGVIESVNDQLKNISQIEHTRHRSVWNFIANILGALIAYMLKPNKPSLNIEKNIIDELCNA